MLSGAREAQLITKAVLSSEAAIPDAIIDVGGGSTEISILNPSKEPLPLSFEIGVARTTKLLYPKENQAACSKGVVLLRQRLRETLYPFLNSHAVRSRRSLLATSGSLFALLRYSNAAGETLRKDQVHEITVALEGISLRKIENSLPLKDSWRAATLLASSLIADECIRALSTEMIHFRRHSLADGLACEIAQESKETGIGSSRRELKGL